MKETNITTWWFSREGRHQKISIQTIQIPKIQKYSPSQYIISLRIDEVDNKKQNVSQHLRSTKT